MSERRGEAQRATLTIINTLGIHLRPAQLIAQRASSFSDCEVAASKAETRVNAKSIMGLTELVGACGDQIVFEVRGPQAAECLDGLRQLFAEGFGEEIAAEFLSPASRREAEESG
jgi:phosphocarrier protein